MGPHPAVAEVRSAVRRCLGEFAAGDLVLAACSGGADSLALAGALAHEASRGRVRGGGVTVDHGLQPGSADRAVEVTRVLAGLGLDPVERMTVRVPGAAGHGGPEAAARDARYQALDEAARRTGAQAVLLAHSRDDQAESVLLGLARGSGARSLAGMPPRRGLYRRPLLGVSRADFLVNCLALMAHQQHGPGHERDRGDDRDRPMWQQGERRTGSHRQHHLRRKRHASPGIHEQRPITAAQDQASEHRLTRFVPLPLVTLLEPPQ